MDLLVPQSKREKDAVAIREDVNGGIKVNTLTLWSSEHVKMGTDSCDKTSSFVKPDNGSEGNDSS